MSKPAGFSKWRSFIWPIHGNENKKFIPMLIMFFLISFNYNILRAAKDTLIVTAPSSGAEAIPFIKVWAILPMAFLMTYLFTKLSNKYSREKVFHIMMVIFLTFFTIFTFILYPIRDFLQPSTAIHHLENILPSGFMGLLAIIRNWTLTAFYVMAELWSTIILTVLFWGFANEITTVHEAKRFYGILGVGANIAGIISGQVAILLSSNLFIPMIPYGKTAWEQSVLFMNLTVITTGIIIMFIYQFLNKKIAIEQDSLPKIEEPKIKMSLRKNFSYLAKSKYLICIALIVVTYNICINLVEIIWKNQIKQLYSNPSDYNSYMGEVMTLMGIIATIIAIFISGNVLRKFSWTFSAIIPPLMVLSTAVIFFAFILMSNSSLLYVSALLGSTPLAMSVFFGSVQNCISRASKYTLFDATKEMSFIPLSKECKMKGKAAIDGVGSRIGKSGSAIIYQAFLIIFSTLSASTPYIALIFLVFIGIWMLSVLSLGKQFTALVEHKEKLLIPDTGTPHPVQEKPALQPDIYLDEEISFADETAVVEERETEEAPV